MASSYGRIPAELRPLVVEEIRRLNGLDLYDAEIAAKLGYSIDTIRTLRATAGIPAIRTRPKGKRGQPKAFAGRDLHPCPACQLSVEVRRNIIETHNLLTGRECPASRCRYDALSKAIAARMRDLARAA